MQQNNPIMSCVKSVGVITGLILCCLIMMASVNGASNSSAEEKVSRRRRDSSAAGVMFTRWGRSVCPQASELVYNGYVGGAYYTHKGSGSNYICLPHNPIFGKVIPGVQGWRGRVYGTEYQHGGFRQNFDSFSNKNVNQLHDSDAPCAVCVNWDHSIAMMIPGRNQCYPGWQAEYKGYLVSQRYDLSGKTEFVCLDEDPEGVNGGQGNEDGARFYQVEGVCGALPCPPYGKGKELTCVVCTQ